MKLTTFRKLLRRKLQQDNESRETTKFFADFLERILVYVAYNGGFRFGNCGAGEHERRSSISPDNPDF